jgi:hypothetical protein
MRCHDLFHYCLRVQSTEPFSHRQKTLHMNLLKAVHWIWSRTWSTVHYWNKIIKMSIISTYFCIKSAVNKFSYAKMTHCWNVDLTRMSLILKFDTALHLLHYKYWLHAQALKIHGWQTTAILPMPEQSRSSELSPQSLSPSQNQDWLIQRRRPPGHLTWPGGQTNAAINTHDAHAFYRIASKTGRLKTRSNRTLCSPNSKYAVSQMLALAYKSMKPRLTVLPLLAMILRLRWSSNVTWS